MKQYFFIFLGLTVLAGSSYSQNWEVFEKGNWKQVQEEIENLQANFQGVVWIPESACPAPCCGKGGEFPDGRNETGLETRNSVGMTPLALAVSFGNSLEVVQGLLEAGANPNTKDAKLRTPLMLACTADRRCKISSSTLSVVKLLVEYGANVNAESQYCNNVYEQAWSPLIFASAYSTPEVVMFLLESGVEKYYHGQLITALDKASYHNTDPKVVSVLIDAGIPAPYASSWGRRFLENAVLGNSNPKVLETLIDAGMEMNGKNRSGWSVLHYAVEKKTPRFLEILLAKGVNCRGGALVNYKLLNDASRNEAIFGTQAFLDLEIAMAQE